MIESNFQLIGGAADEPSRITDAERVERVKLVAANVEVYGRLNNWDKDFLTDIAQRQIFTRRQRFEIDRIWSKWGSFC